MTYLSLRSAHSTVRIQCGPFEDDADARRWAEAVLVPPPPNDTGRGVDLGTLEEAGVLPPVDLVVEE